ncbi:unnamed protein product [Prunus armeniaca]|uniref:Peptidase S8/S53 domain-containing protein n=1 Tax=Prunus armeniaca TaxID=36596 RepID=A0A6J5WU31_PRUAR|nr:unnamed protein product [Prunus armeniaca]
MKNDLQGFSAVLSSYKLHALKKHRGFISAIHERITTSATTYTPKQYLSLVQSPTSKYGEDVIIGVIDSGIWPKQPSFQDHRISTKPAISYKWKGSCGQEFNSSLCNFKLVGAKYFNKGNYVDKVSFLGYGHGTASGVAIRAMLEMCKVVWDDGNSYFSDIIAVIDEVVADGVDSHMAGSGMGELRAPIFNGSNYDFWRIKMCTIFKSHKLWDMVENGYEQPVKKEDGEALTVAQKLTLEENVAKDAKAWD